MRLVTYQHNEQTKLGIWLGGELLDLRAAYIHYCQATHTPTSLQEQFVSMQALLMAGEPAWKAAAETAEYVQEHASLLQSKSLLVDQKSMRLLAPLPAPGKVICIAGNYPAAGKMTAPDYPIVFLKPSSSITGPGSAVQLSDLTTNVAYEAELVIVIGKRAHKVPAEHAQEYIAGYSLANDLGDRGLEKRTSQWTSGKMFDTFTPFGPALFTLDEVPNPQALPITTWVNDQLVQEGSTAEMFFDTNSLTSTLSYLTTLEPGDIILTGSPKLMRGEAAPVLALKAGDIVKVSVGNLGVLANPVILEPA